MVGVSQIHKSSKHPGTGIKQQTGRRLKRPWRYGQAYLPIVGIIVLTLLSLGVLQLHSFYQAIFYLFKKRINATEASDQDLIEHEHV